jgi:hypothetical protein
VQLTSSEITNLWKHYISETMSLQINQYAANTIQCKSIKSLFSNAIRFSEDHIKKMQTFFEKEKFPTPQGFTNDDVHSEASALFTDRFWLEYLYHSAINGNSSYSLAFNNSVRKDIREFYYQCLTDSMNTYNQSIDMLLEKGWYDRDPSYATPKKVCEFWIRIRCFWKSQIFKFNGSRKYLF